MKQSLRGYLINKKIIFLLKSIVNSIINRFFVDVFEVVRYYYQGHKYIFIFYFYEHLHWKFELPSSRK